MQTILVPVDGSGHALKALRIACDLSEKYGGRIALLHVLTEGRRPGELLELETAKTFGPKLQTALLEAVGSDPEPVPETLLAAIGESVLAQAAERVRRRGIETDILAVERGDPADTILIAQMRTRATTIVMGCRGVSRSATSAFGSVSNKVFEKAPCTCLSVK